MEDRKYITITTVSNRARYYNGWNVELSAEQLTIMCGAINLQERYHHKKVTTHLYELRDNSSYKLVSTFGGICNTLHQQYTSEEMSELETMINKERE